MNFKYSYITPKTQEEKYKLMQFVYENTDNFVLNTFGYLWEVRQWWEKFPILIATYEDTPLICGLHAFTVNTKAPNTLKTYYIVTGRNYLGKGIAKNLTLKAIGDSQLFCDTFYVNSNTSEGVAFYRKLIGNPTSEKYAEFGLDYEFEAKFSSILK